MGGKINLHNVDCMEFMAGVPDNYYDLAIVDPPYGIDLANMNMGVGKSKKAFKAKNRKWSAKDWDKEIPNKEYFEELFRVSKNQIVWGGNYMVEHLYSTPCLLIWDKMQEFSGAVFETAWTSFTSPSKAFRMSRASAYCNQNKIHPTQKPVKLYEWLLMNYAKEGDKILDTHGGSMSIAIACHNLGFDLDLCEIDKEYFEAGKKRLNQHQAQLTMF